MRKVKQKSKLTKVGSSYGFIVSKKLIDAEVLVPGQYYEYEIEDLKEDLKSLQYSCPDYSHDSRTTFAEALG